MNDLFHCLLKSSLCLGVLYLLYVSVIKNIAKPEFKRVYLVFALLVSVLIPLITTSWSNSYDYLYSATYEPLIRGESGVFSVITTSNNTQTTTSSGLLYSLVYGFGFLVFLVRVLWSFARIYIIRTKAQVTYFRSIKLFVTDTAKPAFSFLNDIYISAEALEDGDSLPMILNHESTHTSQFHSIDAIIVQLYTVFFWFNPFCYLIKKEIALSIEQLADKAVCRNFGAKEYILTLLNYQSSTRLSLVTQFVKHPIKARVEEIVSLSEGRKKRPNWIPVLCALPVVLSLVVFLGRMSVVPSPFQGSNPSAIDCDCEHIHLTTDNRVIVVQEGEYGAVQRME